jgi:hypothetical protein
MRKKTIFFIFLTTIIVIFITVFFIFEYKKNNFPERREEFAIQGLTWRTVSYYYNPYIYKILYNKIANLRLIFKAKEAGADYLLVRAFYDGTEDGGLIGDEEEAKLYLGRAIKTAHDFGIKIFLAPYVESRDYWVAKKWTLSEDLWTETILKWARFAEDNDVEMFSPGVEMNLILDEDRVGSWLKEILPKIREVYNGKVITAEHYDIERWKILDEEEVFWGYDCIGLTIFPRKSYDGVSDMRSLEDYTEYVEKEAEVIDMLSEKYDIQCKLAVPIGLDYWQGSYPSQPVPEARDVAEAANLGLDILKRHNFTGVFISHWASEHDHFGAHKEMESMLSSRWTTARE